MLNHCRRFLRARDYSVEAALEQYRTTRAWRDKNRLLELYDRIEISDYEETRKLVRTSLLAPEMISLRIIRGRLNVTLSIHTGPAAEGVAAPL